MWAVLLTGVIILCCSLQREMCYKCITDHFTIKQNRMNKLYKILTISIVTLIYSMVFQLPIALGNYKRIIDRIIKR